MQVAVAELGNLRRWVGTVAGEVQALLRACTTRHAPPPKQCGTGGAHPLHRRRMPSNICDICGATGTEFRCGSGCDWDLCAGCHGPDFAGQYQQLQRDLHADPRTAARAAAGRQVFVPVVPLFERLLDERTAPPLVAAVRDQEPAAAAAAAAAPEPEPEDAGAATCPAGGAELHALQVQLPPPGPAAATSPVLPLADVNRFLAEQRRSLAVAGGGGAAEPPPAARPAPAAATFFDAEGDQSTIQLDGGGDGGAPRLSWHSGGTCYLEDIALLDYDAATATLVAPQHQSLVATLVDPPAGPARDILLSDLAAMAAGCSARVYVRGLPAPASAARQADEAQRLLTGVEHMQTLLGTWALSVDYIEAMLHRVGKTTGSAPQNHGRTTKNRGQTPDFGARTMVQPWIFWGRGLWFCLP